MNLTYRLLQAIRTPSDISDHLLTLVEFGSKCTSIAELGVREGNSTLAFLFSRPSLLFSVDLRPKPNFDNLVPPMTCWQFVLADSREVILPKVDLLLIDTTHTYSHLKAELDRHVPKVSKFIILHDTETYKRFGYVRNSNLYPDRTDCEDGALTVVEGVGRAIYEFEREFGHQWKLFRHYPNNNGLTIYARD